MHEREYVTIPTAEGSLEALVERGGAPDGPILLLCHPHPQYGGSMDDTVIETVADALAPRLRAHVRFNFRGVGASTGRFDGGRGEVEDVESAAHEIAGRWPGTPLWLGGYSFGSAMVWQALRSLAPARVLLVAPPVGAMAFGRWPALAARVDVVFGDADQFLDAAMLATWARDAAPVVAVHRIDGADHFFGGRTRELRRIVAALP